MLDWLKFISGALVLSVSLYAAIDSRIRTLEVNFAVVGTKVERIEKLLEKRS